MKRILPACLLLTVLAFPARAATAGAAPGVSVRSAPHGDHDRVVFQWPAATGYQIDRHNGNILVTFAAPGTLDAAEVKADARIAGVTPVSGAGQNLRVEIAVPPGATVQDFTAGGRVILDIYGEGKATPPAPEQKSDAPSMQKPAAVPAATPAIKASPVVTATPAKSPPSIQTPQTQTTVTPPAPGGGPVAVAAPAPMPATAGLTAPPQLADRAVVTLALTEQAGAAAFIRNGRLWLVLDHPGVNATPKVTGPHAGDFSPFRRVDAPSVTAFEAKLDMATPCEIYGEGSGLVWRIVLTPVARAVRPATMQRAYAADGAASVSWPLAGVTDVVDLPDPDTGDVVKVATVPDASAFAGPPTDTVDFTALRSIIGLALAEKADDLTVTRTPDRVQVTRPKGLALSSRQDLTFHVMRQNAGAVANPPPATPGQAAAPAATAPGAPMSGQQIFDFNGWSMDNLAAAQTNERALLAGLHAKDTDGQVQDMLTMAKMALANDRSAEATGFLDYAQDTLPAMADATQFKALRGAADTLLGRDEAAVTDFAAPDLKPFPELGYWRAYNFAALEDWRQAKAVMPADATVLLQYPLLIRDKLLLKLAEADLHAGDLSGARALLSALERDRKMAMPGTVAGLDYLQGEAAQQGGDTEAARRLWTPLVTGPDHLYRAKAGLALTALELQKKEITPAKATDRLEGLRYTWRGDELEAAINYMLGKLYLDQKKYLKGFDILRDAATMDPDSDIGHDIKGYMQSSFITLLMQDKTISPIDAAEIYGAFPELIPPDGDGDKLGQRIAERLVEGDLLGRAADILQKQVDTRLQGPDRARVAGRLAAIYLLDKNPQKAMVAAQLAEQLYAQLPDPAAKIEVHRAQLMQARALSQENKPADALAMLEKFPPDAETNALRADIAWSAGMWDRAAGALQDMILDQITDPNAPLTQGQADLILNRAVALNLAGNRVALANLHARYADAMSRTSRGKLFDIVARPRESALLSDKDTLNAIVGEVDIFKGFLEGYRGAGK